MKAQIQKLLEVLGRAGLGAKIVLGAGALAVAAVLVFAAWRAKNPSFKQLYSELEAAEAAAAQSALATAGIRYQVAGQPPGPFVIYADEARYYEAQNAVALSGALAAVPAGIQVGGGTSDVFLSADERRQTMRKREWQEMEKQLAVLDFVRKASVSTSAPKSTLGRSAPPPTVAVMLQLRSDAELSRSQAETVAKLVRHRFDVPSANVVISDQTGRSLYDGTAEADFGPEADGLFDHKQRYEEDLAQRTNTVLDRVFGEGKAYVVLNSDWRWEESETVVERYDPKGVVVAETKLESETPQQSPQPAGGPAGVASNLVGAGLDPASGAADAAEPAVATTSEETRNSLVGKETQLTRDRSPKLERLSVSLWLDKSLSAELQSLESSVKTSVGFDEERGDLFSSMVTAFAALPRDAEGNVIPAEPPPPAEEPSALLELALEHGVEAVAAIAFLIVLFKALKGSRRTAAPAAPASRAEEDIQALELLAKSQIEELVRSEPERVSSILSRWASEEPAVRA